ncbi:inorganic phosphate transporter [Heliophilum fasciatum]|uniref:PiT family inorganic phosphate transporter n=1 Tax=Heliophilum fasciatum TaxID=35700 RepID=A0A4R2RXK4_9FIRM|nr:inorganic phosphate transporter [Heliophilum fasciatum]MCW2277145.1 PiT family inorganic phosphate transporter [Heliophilum fasciatum]TCP68218.1 PiT family inorganic phosphate transporter [Heliophilum fasciatum]
MPSAELAIFVVVLLALLFDYINGFHDTANAVATSVSTRAMTPSFAIGLAAVMNFIGALSGTAVAKTIGSDIVMPAAVTQHVLFAALIAAIFWNLLTWYYGIPSSSSHALIGGLVGAAVASQGFGVLKTAGVIKVVAFLVLSPLIGLTVGYLVMTALWWLMRRQTPSHINRVFLKLQILASTAGAFSHGSNDAQKSMGIITMALFGAGLIPKFEVPFWVTLACAIAMALGTAVGGWKIIRTMGGRIVKLEPINGFAADLSSASVIYGSTLLGMPVSTTHVVSSCIMGVGSAKRLLAVRWAVAKQIVTAWVLTIPSAAAVAALTLFFVNLF